MNPEDEYLSELCEVVLTVRSHERHDLNCERCKKDFMFSDDKFGIWDDTAIVICPFCDFLSEQYCDINLMIRKRNLFWR
jgi:ribosomal protein L37AE/L43A